MKAPSESAPCPRQFEVEAVRDGRLRGVELARFRAHLEHCPSCRRHSESLSALSRALRELPDVPGDDLHVRRQRTRLLAAFNGRVVASPRPQVASARRWWRPAAAALTATALTLLVTRLGRVPPGTRVTPVEPAKQSPIAIQADESTTWSRQTNAELETITLERGTLSVHVDHRRSPHRLLVILPDATLEDLGTTFTVSTSPVQTTRVVVQDGSVLLRVRGQAPLVLSAGESWSAAPSSAAPAASAPSPLPSAIPSAVATSRVHATARAAATTARVVASARHAEPDAGPASNVAAESGSVAAFRDAVAVLDAGNAARAAALLANFLTEFPSDSHAEDAAYLRVIALQRAGDEHGVKRAAKAYLRDYPNGFRRTEVERLAR